MATADPLRTVSRLSNDRSGSFSDDVVSLDSWSEKLEASVSKTDHSENRPRLSSAGSIGRSGLSHQCVRHHQPYSDVRKQKSVALRSAPPESKSRARDKPMNISTISGNVRSREHLVDLHHGLYGPSRRRSSSASSDSDPSPLHSPRHSAHELTPQSPTRKIPQSGSHYSGGGHFQFAHHLRPQYNRSPVHRGSVGHSSGSTSRQIHSPHHYKGHHQPHYNPNSPRHHQHPGMIYYPSQYPHQSGYHSATNAPIDQILEREGEKLKTKMKSMWNNVKYGWTIKTRTSFKYDSPIFLLGRCYHRRAEEEPTELEQQQQQQQQHQHQHQHHHQPYRVSALVEFQADFTSRLWFTYRREFSPIGSSRMTTDCGWGCMLRSGQMMMAQALVLHFLRRDWKVYSEQKREDLAFYREIIRWFGDIPSDKVPFSLHRLVELGTSVGKMPGDWYGPASVAHIFRDAMDKAHISLPILSDVCVYVAQDCTIYLQDLNKALTGHGRSNSHRSSGSVSEYDSHPHPSSSSSSSQPRGGGSRLDSGASEDKFRSVIILVPMRLGGEVLNEIYVPCVKSMLAHDHCIGIIGGRPKHSLYFVGWQEDKLIYLDPHYCQDTVDTTESTFPIQSYHCMSPRKMVFSKMDPSCTVGFYCRDRHDLDTFIEQVPDMVVPPRQRTQYPLFVVSQGSSEDTHPHNTPVREMGRLRIQHMRTDPHTGQRVRSPTLDSEDFVIL